MFKSEVYLISHIVVICGMLVSISTIVYLLLFIQFLIMYCKQMMLNLFYIHFEIYKLAYYLHWRSLARSLLKKFWVDFDDIFYMISIFTTVILTDSSEQKSELSKSALHQRRSTLNPGQIWIWT